MNLLDLVDLICWRVNWLVLWSIYCRLPSGTKPPVPDPHNQGPDRATHRILGHMPTFCSATAQILKMPTGKPLPWNVLWLANSITRVNQIAAHSHALWGWASHNWSFEMHDSDRSKALKSRAIHSLDEVALLVSGFSWHWRFRSVRRTGAAGRCVFRRKEAWEYNSTAYCRLRSTWDL